MEKAEFLEQYIFVDLNNLNDGFNPEAIHYFSESDFEKVLERSAKFGVGIYGIEPWFDGKLYGVKGNEDYNKKATDPKWYNKAFMDFKKEKADLQYSATFRVSEKLLNKKNLDF